MSGAGDEYFDGCQFGDMAIFGMGMSMIEIILHHPLIYDVVL